MKKIVTIVLFVVGSIASWAQAPQSFKYQAVARNASGNPIASANISVRLSIRDVTATGTIVYRETHAAATNALGLFTISVGGGTVVGGTFASIAWGTGNKFIEVEADFAGGTTYTSLGASQLLSVPYALFAASGNTGTAGATGAQGPAGLTGAQGPVGLTGSTGPAGAIGASGSQGIIGLTGSAGAIGAVGVTGPQGPTGLLAVGTSAGNTPYWNGAIWVTNNSNIFNSGGSVGIGTTTTNAKLDIAGNIKITDGTQGAGKILTSDASGLASWAAPVGGGWGLTGTAGTVDGTNFIGTTDAKSFDINTNNALKVRITTKGQIEVHNTGNSLFLGEGAGANDDLLNRRNLLIGYQAGSSTSVGDENTSTGYQSLYSNTTGGQNTAYGYQALYFSDLSFENTAVGHQSMYSNSLGGANTATGYGALLSNTTGNCNTAHGHGALYLNTIGYNNVAVGQIALVSSTTGNFNSAFGQESLRSNTTGSNNTAIGYNAFSQGSNFSNATAIGANSAVTDSNMMVFGDPNVTKWGFGVSPTSGNAFQVGGNGNGNGAALTNGGTWTNASDKNKKENFSGVNGREILTLVGKLPITRWNYIGEAASIQHIGPTAQDFYKLFQVGGNETSISTIDPAGIALVAIQELIRENKEQQKMINTLQTQATERDKKIAELEGEKSQHSKKVAELESSKTELEILKAEVANIKKVLGMEASAKKK